MNSLHRGRGNIILTLSAACLFQVSMISPSLLRSRAGIYLRVKRTYQLFRYTRAHYSSRDLERMTASLDTLQFDNRTLRSLPLDKEKENYVRTVSGNGGCVFSVSYFVCSRCLLFFSKTNSSNKSFSRCCLNICSQFVGINCR